MLLDHYIARIWPLQRHLVRGLSRRCKRCIASEKAVTLDAEGICGECRSFVPVVNPPPVAEVGVGSGVVALLLSGGKDSCYLLSRWKDEHPRQTVVAIFVDNGFSSTQAVTNCETICRSLNVDLLVVRKYVPALKDGLRRAFLRMKATNGTSYDVIDHTDGSEIFKIGQVMARSFGAKVLLTGLSREQVVLHDGSAVLENKLGVMVSPLAAWNPTDDEIFIWLKVRHALNRGDFNPTLTNHRLIPVMCAIDVMNHGYCSFEREFSNRIRCGEAEKRKWLHTFEALEWFVKRGWMTGIVRKELSLLNLTIDDVLVAK